MMSKLKILLPLLLVVGGGAYKFVLAKPATPATKPKVQGEVYVLPKDFLVNLADGRFGKLNVALVFDHGYTSAAAAAANAQGGHGASGSTSDTGYGVLPQEPVVRDIVTDMLTDATAAELQNRDKRERLKQQIARKIDKTTDVKVGEVLFTDVAVQ